MYVDSFVSLHKDTFACIYTHSVSLYPYKYWKLWVHTDFLQFQSNTSGFILVFSLLWQWGSWLLISLIYLTIPSISSYATPLHCHTLTRKRAHLTLCWAVTTSRTPVGPAWASALRVGQPSCLGAFFTPLVLWQPTPACPFSADTLFTQLWLWHPRGAAILCGQSLVWFEFWHAALGHWGSPRQGQMPTWLGPTSRLQDWIVTQGKGGWGKEEKEE